MKSKMKRLIALMLMVVMATTMLPVNTIRVKADTATASLSNLGELGTVKIGDKSESGTWWQTKVNKKAVFCKDLGLACHAGDVYESSGDKYKSSSNNKRKSTEAYVGYWYSSTKKKARKAWVYAQCLIWSAEEGRTSDDQLKDVIKQVMTNTGYYGKKNDNKKEVDALFDEIFGAGSVEVDVIIWSSEAYKRQKLLEISGDKIEYPYETYNDTLNYRQRLNIIKEDEDGNRIPQTKFEIAAKNYKDLYSYKFNGWGDAEEEDNDNGSKFEEEVLTDSNGRITFKFNYHLQSEDYAYVKADDLKNMNDNAIKEMKKQMKEDGYKYPDSLKKADAEKMAADDLKAQLNKVSNKYVIKEISSNDKNFTINKDYINGKTITIESANSWTKDADGWPDTTSGEYSHYSLAVNETVVNNHKKIKLQISKKDSKSSDGKARGAASLGGAVYGIYSNSGCTTFATLYNNNGNKLNKQAKYTTDANGKISMGEYLRAGQTYYIKEITPPVGYLLDSTIHSVNLNANSNPVVNLNSNNELFEHSTDVGEAPYGGKLEINKENRRSDTDITPEAGAKFRVWLKSAGSYENAKEEERDIITTDGNGHGISKDLYIGTYRVEQIANGTLNGKNIDLIMVEPFEMTISQDDPNPTHSYKLNNPRYKAFLKIVKKDSKTNKTVLKAGTAYQIKLYDEDTDTWNLVKQQTYIDGEPQMVDTYMCDESGEVRTYEALESGTYRIYEVDSATGLFKKDEFIEVVIHSSKQNTYETYVDEEGNTHNVATVEYVNDETKGKLILEKLGHGLTAFDAKKGFIYEAINLPGSVFEVYAKEDIVTQDSQTGDNDEKTTWFKAGDKVATITSGVKAEFTSDASGICKYKLNEDGNVEITMPLGKYELREVTTRFNYYLPDVHSWDLTYEWKDFETEYVFDIDGITDDNGKLSVQNELVTTDVKIHKQDKDTKKAVPGTVFGFYSKDNIYDKNGNIIVKANEKIATVTTDDNGNAVLPFSVPLMDEELKVNEEEEAAEEQTTEETTTEEVTTEEQTTVENETTSAEESVEQKYNTGNYYWREEKVSGSYFLDQTEIDVHLEYDSQNSKVVTSESVKENKQTEIEIDKLTLVGSNELPGCELEVADTDGNVIAAWTSGDVKTIKLTEKAEELGYCNLAAEMTEKGNLIIKGLIYNKYYILSEKRPADGYCTADSMKFKLVEGKDKNENSTTQVVGVVDGVETVTDSNKVIMYDDTIKVDVSKQEITGDKEIPGCKMAIYLGKKKIESWTSSKKPHRIQVKLIAGEKYTLIEEEAAKGYEIARNIDFTVKDTGEIQTIVMKDRKIGKIKAKIPFIGDGDGIVWGSPKTGDFRDYMIWFALLGISAYVAFYSYFKGSKKSDEK